MKIAYILESMFNSGGVERVISQKANWLVNHDIDVTIITINQQDKKDFFYLESNVRRIDMNLRFGECHSRKEVLRMIKSALEKILINEKFNCVISTYGREFYILNEIKDPSIKYVEFHFALNINEKWTINNEFNLSKWLRGKISTFRMIYYAKKFDKIIVLTESDKTKWKRYTNKVIQIYNPLTISTNNSSECSNKSVIAVGRMDYQKGFDYLIEAWRLVYDMHPDWHLNIFGGGDASQYVKLIDEFNLAKTVFLKGVVSKIESEYLNSSIFVLSSRYEGFPLVIEEAMLCGLPIISFNCPSGPKELIKDGVNGFLIPHVGDVKSLADKICDLIENKELRISMGIESKRLSENFTEKVIMYKWIDLFNSIKKI